MDIARKTASILSEIRKQKPRVHCITNDAAQTFTADTLLALGAEPSLTLSRTEVPDFVGSSDALLINLGTLDENRLAAIPVAVAFAVQNEKPWVLDPVFVHRSPGRLDYAAALLAEKPTVVRCNQAEAAALTGGGNGADPAQTLAERYDTVMAVTGETDEVYGDGQHVSASNGDPLMGKMTATGCAGSAVLAACLAVEEDRFVAALAALVAWNIAGEVAAGVAKGPGTFRPALLDAIHGLKGPMIKRRVKANLQEAPA